MDISRIAELLRPFAGEGALPAPLLEQCREYLELLLRWNARINLTAIRDPGQMVTRHFGESLFAARVLFAPAETQHGASSSQPDSLADVGAGAGFPGIPIKLLAPQTSLTLIESHNKRATFLREVVRTLELDGVEVFCGRAADWGKTADVVTLRAVEKFAQVLPVAADLVAGDGRLCLLIGRGQIKLAQATLGAGWKWQPPRAVPQSAERVVLMGNKASTAVTNDN